MQAISKTSLVIVIILVAVLVLSAFNAVLFLNRPSGDSNALAYNFVVSQSGNGYQLKNTVSGAVTTYSSASSAISTAFVLGNSVYLNPGNYALKNNIIIKDKVNAEIIGNDASIEGNDFSIILYGDNYTASQFNTISGLTIINGTLRIENSFATTVTNMNFEDSKIGIDVANTNTWSEDTQIDNCYFINNTEGIVFESPTGNATGSYASSEITRSFFNIPNNSVGINVEALAQFSDSQINDVRMWMGEGGENNQTGLLVNGSMYQTLMNGVVFESFASQPNDMFGMNLGANCNPAPMMQGDVNFLGNWTAAIHNPYGIWISGVGTAFERQNISVPVGVNGQYGANVTVQVTPLNIYSFEPEIQVQGSFSDNEKITVRVRLLYADNVLSNSVTQVFNDSGSAWLTNDQMMTLYPSQDVIVGVVFDAQTSAATTNVTVTVSGYGTAG